MRYSLSAGMHLSTSGESPPASPAPPAPPAPPEPTVCSIRFQTFSFAAEKKLLQIYCLCFCCCSHVLVLLAVIIIIISVVSAFVAAAALNTKEFPICGCPPLGLHCIHCIHRPEAPGRTDSHFPPRIQSLPWCFIVARFRFLYLEVGNECLCLTCFPRNVDNAVGWGPANGMVLFHSSPDISHRNYFPKNKLTRQFR